MVQYLVQYLPEDTQYIMVLTFENLQRPFREYNYHKSVGVW